MENGYRHVKTKVEQRLVDVLRAAGTTSIATRKQQAVAEAVLSCTLPYFGEITGDPFGFSLGHTKIVLTSIKSQTVDRPHSDKIEVNPDAELIYETVFGAAVFVRSKLAYMHGESLANNSAPNFIQRGLNVAAGTFPTAAALSLCSEQRERDVILRLNYGADTPAYRTAPVIYRTLAESNDLTFDIGRLSMVLEGRYDSFGIGFAALTYVINGRDIDLTANRLLTGMQNDLLGAALIAVKRDTDRSLEKTLFETVLGARI